MAYNIDRYDGTPIAVVEDGTVDSTLDIKLIGKNYAGYGEIQNENFVFLLENFAGPNPPGKKISGQVWFDSNSKKLKFFDGAKFRTTGGAEVSATAPTGLTSGDLWFDTANDQVSVWNGTEFILVGPQGVQGAGTTQMRSRNLRDVFGVDHPCIEAVSDDAVVFVISKDEFLLDSAVNPITGFTRIKKGTTLAYTNDVTGVANTGSEFVYWGTASDSLRLGGKLAIEYITSVDAAFQGLASFTDFGLTVGDDDDFKISVVGGNIPVIQNQVGTTIEFRTTIGGTTSTTPLRLVGNHVLPGTDNVHDIGSPVAKFKTIYAYSFDGTSTRSDALNLNGTYRTAATSATANTIAGRDSSGNISANLFEGTATSARYADLAEKYLTDQEYEVGTVVSVGGTAEVRESMSGDMAIGVISGKPAFKMNSDLEGGQYVALKGRVPVKVIGKIKKGDRLVPTDNGCAVRAEPHNYTEVFGLALDTSDDTSVKLIESVIL